MIILAVFEPAVTRETPGLAEFIVFGNTSLINLFLLLSDFFCASEAVSVETSEKFGLFFVQSSDKPP